MPCSMMPRPRCLTVQDMTVMLLSLQTGAYAYTVDRLQVSLGVQVGPASLNLLQGKRHARVKRLLGQAFSEEAVAAVLPALVATTHCFLQRSAGTRPYIHKASAVHLFNQYFRCRPKVA